MGAEASTAPGSSTSFNLPFTIPTNATNPILLVDVMIPNITSSITTATYNGVALTQAVSIQSNGYTDVVYYMLGSNLQKDGIAHNVSIVQSGAAPDVIGAVSYMNASQSAIGATTTYSQTQNNTHPSIYLTTNNANSMIGLLGGPQHGYPVGDFSSNVSLYGQR
jgi:hypothetical protein